MFTGTASLFATKRKQWDAAHVTYFKNVGQNPEVLITMTKVFLTELL